MSKNKLVTHSVDWHWGKNEPPAEVEIVPGVSVRIKGLGCESRGQLPDGRWVNYRPKFDRTFKLGDTVEYHSYNLRYTGEIVSIGPKLISVKDHGKVTRMKLRDFVFRNWDLNLEELAKENSETMMRI